jgi:hypothetical protein
VPEERAVTTLLKLDDAAQRLTLSREGNRR